MGFSIGGFDPIGDTLGAFSGGLVGNDVYGLDLTGAGAAADAAAAQGASNSAARAAEEKASQQSLKLQREQWDYQKELQAPWQAAGRRGLEGYESLLQDPSQVTRDPGYQFGLQQGTSSIENSQLAQGMGLSGNTLQSINKFGQDYAGSKFGEALGRQQTLASYGQNATNQLSQGSQQFGSSMSNIIQQGGANQSNFHMNQGAIAAQEAQAGHAGTMGLLNLGVTGAGMFFGGPAGGAAAGAAFSGITGGGGGGPLQSSAGAVNPFDQYK